MHKYIFGNKNLLKNLRNVLAFYYSFKKYELFNFSLVVIKSNLYSRVTKEKENHYHQQFRHEKLSLTSEKLFGYTTNSKM